MNIIAENSRLKKLARFKPRRGASAPLSARSSAFQLTAARGLFLIYLILASLVALTWGATADILIDFGRELYIPWQLLEGKALYKDIAYFNGPLSPHFNALVFRLFGDTVVTLVVTNMILLAMLVTCLYMVLLRYFSVVASTVACICMLTMFGIAHMTPHGNYNYITPYSHELTHGLFLAFAMLALLRHEETFKLWKWSLIGILWGLVFLGKAELFFATTAMLGCSLLLPLFGKKITIRQVMLRMGTAAGFAALPILGFWLLLCSQTGPAEAALNLLGTWRYIFTSEVCDLYYYRHMAGTTHLAWNLMTIVRACALMGCILFGLYALERNIGGRGWGNPIPALLLMLALYLSGMSAFVLHPRAFFLIAVVLVLTLFCLAVRRQGEFQKYHHLACWAVLAVCIMFKIMLAPNFILYGFALTMPVVVLTVAIAIDWLPRVLARGSAGKKCRLALIVLLLLDATLALAKTATFSSEKNYVIGSGWDRMRCTPKQGVPLHATTDYLANHMAPGETLLVLPEGISLNYLLRRENNSPHVNFMPPELVMYGEENIVADFKRNPSDYVVLVSRTLDNYGLRHFGQPGYGDKIMEWVRANYVIEKQIGADPFEPEEFGVQILRRRSQKAVAQRS